jgi:hypothetical protein
MDLSGAIVRGISNRKKETDRRGATASGPSEELIGRSQDNSSLALVNTGGKRK